MTPRRTVVSKETVTHVLLTQRKPRRKRRKAEECIFEAIDCQSCKLYEKGLVLCKFAEAGECGDP